MEKIRRNERMSAMMKILADHPNQIFTLSHFCDLFGAAKSTMSEDIDILRKVIDQFSMGQLETVTGAAGGVRYRARIAREDAFAYVNGLCENLSGTERLLPGGFLYYSDVLSSPEITHRMGGILATEYFDAEPDFVLTMETKGIPVALTTAHALGVPLVIARHNSRVYEGSAVNINYVSGSSGNIQTMSLARRSVREGQRALIVDDFLKGGGTAKGMVDLMREFSVTPTRKRVQNAKSLMTLEITGGDEPEAIVRPAAWLSDGKA